LTKDENVEPTDIMKVAVEIYRQSVVDEERTTLKSLQKALKGKITRQEIKEGLYVLHNIGAVNIGFGFDLSSNEESYYSIALCSEASVKRLYELFWAKKMKLKEACETLIEATHVLEVDHKLSKGIRAKLKQIIDQDIWEV